jgi:hypothetical protein
VWHPIPTNEIEAYSHDIISIYRHLLISKKAGTKVYN